MRKVLLKLHLYLGLLAGMVAMVIGTTGAVLVFEDELDRAFRSDLWAVTPEGTPQSVDSLLATVRAAYPDRNFLTIEVDSDPRRPYVMAIEHEFQVFIDPYRGRILGEREYGKTFWGLIFDLHRTLLAGEVGRRIVGGTTILLLILVMSGLYLWWPRRLVRLGSSLMVTWRGSWKRVTLEAHSVFGFYASWFLMLVALTGLVWSFAFVHHTIFWITDSPSPPWKARHHSVLVHSSSAIQLKQALARAEELVPDASLTEILLPQRPHDPIKLMKRVPCLMNPNAQSFVSVDQYSGQVLQVARYEDISLGATIRLLVYPIHVGSIFGWPTKVLAFLVSAFVPVSAITGVLLWWNRRKTYAALKT